MSLRNMRVLLIVSVALNIFIVSAIAGGSYMLVRSQQAERAAAMNWRQAAANVLQPNDRAVFLQALRRVSRENAALVRQAQEGRAEAARLFVGDTFDAKAANAALARARSADLEVRTSLEETVVALADKLSPEDRRLLAERLATGPLRRAVGAVTNPGSTTSR